MSTVQEVLFLCEDSCFTPEDSFVMEGEDTDVKNGEVQDRAWGCVCGEFGRSENEDKFEPCVVRHFCPEKVGCFSACSNEIVVVCEADDQVRRGWVLRGARYFRCVWCS